MTTLRFYSLCFVVVLVCFFIAAISEEAPPEISMTHTMQESGVISPTPVANDANDARFSLTISEMKNNQMNGHNDEHEPHSRNVTDSQIISSHFHNNTIDAKINPLLFAQYANSSSRLSVSNRRTSKVSYQQYAYPTKYSVSISASPGPAMSAISNGNKSFKDVDSTMAEMAQSTQRDSFLTSNAGESQTNLNIGQLNENENENDIENERNNNNDTDTLIGSNRTNILLSKENVDQNSGINLENIGNNGINLKGDNINGGDGKLTGRGISTTPSIMTSAKHKHAISKTPSISSFYSATAVKCFIFDRNVCNLF